jgi:Domain of unknown function (DUF4062)
LTIINIFVSSRFDELKDERKVVKEKISTKNRCVFIFEDDAGARTENPSKAYRNEVINSDIYIGIFKHKYSRPTKQEYDTALKNSKDILIYVYTDEENREDDLSSFLSLIKKNHTISTYENLSSLTMKINEDLERLLRAYPKSS